MPVQKLPSSMSIHRLPVEGVAQVRGGFFQAQKLKGMYSTSKIWIRSEFSYFKLSKNPSEVCLLILGFS